MIPPKPAARAGRVSLWRYMRLFRDDILSAQPERLYRAKMAAFRTPFFQSVMINQMDLVREVLVDRPEDFPKSDRVNAGLRPLLGNSIFLTNGETWARQRRIIDPAFDRGRLKDSFPAMLAAGQAAVARLAEGPQDIEPATSHVAADVIFRTLFSVPIEDQAASRVFHAFKAYQRAAPVLNLAALIPWAPARLPRRAREAAAEIRSLITGMVAARAAEIEAGTAPDDLATKIMTTPDPETGQTFGVDEMVDQVAIFFLAGHETGAAALAWALYLLASHPEAQERVAGETAALGPNPEFSKVQSLKFTRDVFREALRLYPPVPMVVRETTGSETFRRRPLKAGAQVVVSSWHLGRHEAIWDSPDAFDPDRWGQTGCPREAWLPFSAGARVCPGAGFAMLEGPLLLALIVGTFRLNTVTGKRPVPIAHLTVRGKDGIWVSLARR